MARLLVPAASPGAAPSSGDLATVLAVLRRSIEAMWVKLGQGIARGGSVGGEEWNVVKNWSGGGLYL
jgi:hypothetical protein